MTKGAKELRSDSQSDFEDAQGPCRSNMLHLTEGLVPKFSGQDKAYTATRWIQDIEDNAEIFGWTAVQQLLVARRALCGTAELWFRSEKTYKTWDDLKANITKEFPDSIDAKTIHEMMSARKKKDSESCLDYMFCMKELGKRGKLADYVAIKYIIEGIRDNELNKIMLYGVTTYSDLKEKLKIYEQLRENLRSSSTPRPGKPKDERSERSVRCYSCGELNHTSVDCPHKEKGVKCFRCNGFGHISSKCTVNNEM